LALNLVTAYLRFHHQSDLVALLALQEIPSPLLDLLAAMLAQLEHLVWVLMWVPQALSSVLLHPNPMASHLGTANNRHPLDWVVLLALGEVL
jgi:hypothetical protein